MELTWISPFPSWGRRHSDGNDSYKVIRQASNSVKTSTRHVKFSIVIFHQHHEKRHEQRLAEVTCDKELRARRCPLPSCLISMGKGCIISKHYQQNALMDSVSCLKQLELSWSISKKTTKKSHQSEGVVTNSNFRREAISLFSQL